MAVRTGCVHLVVATLAVWLLDLPLGAQPSTRPPSVLPEMAVAKLDSSLNAARRHRQHIWRDTPPFDGDGLVNAYVEIPRGERRKYEFATQAHDRVIDRIIPEDVGGYPVNYGFVPSPTTAIRSTRWCLDRRCQVDASCAAELSA
jgi:hypothetical protein